jgi:Sporulation and spore germination
MSERTDRRIRSDRLLLALIVLLVAAAGAGGYLWLGAGAQQSVAKAAQERHPIAPADLRDEPVTVTLFLPQDGWLAAQPAGVKRQPDVQLQAREAVLALLEDPPSAQIPVLRDMKFKAFYCDASGTAYIDLSPVQKDVRASAEDEFLAIYSLVNTVLQNFDELQKVRILLDGNEAQTFAGHMDLSRAFTKRTDLVKR